MANRLQEFLKKFFSKRTVKKHREDFLRAILLNESALKKMNCEMKKLSEINRTIQGLKNGKS